jgi:hypothetical protein
MILLLYLIILKNLTFSAGNLHCMSAPPSIHLRDEALRKRRKKNLCLKAAMAAA